MKNINARANERTEKYITDHFRTKGAGAEYILAAVPAAARKFMGLDIKGKFTANELKLMIDVMTGTKLSPDLAGQHLQLKVSDGIALDHLDDMLGIDKTSGVDAETLNKKLSIMSTPELMIMEIWIHGFWHAGQDLDEYIQVAL